jgi:transcriptional regulator with XRE-family HTH domain
MPTNPDLPSAKLVIAVRARLGLTQDEMADRAGLDRIEILNVEKGRNKASSARIRDGLAQAIGISVEQVSAGLEGKLSPAAILALVAAHQKLPAKRRPRRAPKILRPAA